MNQLETIAKQPLTKTQVQLAAFDYLQERLRKEDPIILLTQLVRMKTALDTMEEMLRDEVTDYLNGDKGEYNGVQIMQRKGKVTYDYSADPRWKKKREELDEYEKYLRELKEPIPTDMGLPEVIPATRKEGKAGLTLTLK